MFENLSYVEARKRVIDNSSGIISNRRDKRDNTNDHFNQKDSGDQNKSGYRDAVVGTGMTCSANYRNNRQNQNNRTSAGHQSRTMCDAETQTGKPDSN